MAVEAGGVQSGWGAGQLTALTFLPSPWVVRTLCPLPSDITPGAQLSPTCPAASQSALQRAAHEGSSRAHVHTGPTMRGGASSHGPSGGFVCISWGTAVLGERTAGPSAKCV